MVPVSDDQGGECDQDTVGISRVGEWYPEELLEPIREFLSMYDRDVSRECDEEKARSTRRRL